MNMKTQNNLVLLCMLEENSSKSHTKLMARVKHTRGENVNGSDKIIINDIIH